MRKLVPWINELIFIESIIIFKIHQFIRKRISFCQLIYLNVQLSLDIDAIVNRNWFSAEFGNGDGHSKRAFIAILVVRDEVAYLFRE